MRRRPRRPPPPQPPPWCDGFHGEFESQFKGRTCVLICARTPSPMPAALTSRLHGVPGSLGLGCSHGCDRCLLESSTSVESFTAPPPLTPASRAPHCAGPAKAAGGTHQNCAVANDAGRVPVRTHQHGIAVAVDPLSRHLPAGAHGFPAAECGGRRRAGLRGAGCQAPGRRLYLPALQVWLLACSSCPFLLVSTPSWS